MAQCGKTRNSLSPKKNSSNQLYSNFFNKTITFTKILQKSERCVCFLAHNAQCGKTKILSHQSFFFVNQLVFAVGRQKSTAPTSTAVVSNRPDRGRLFGRFRPRFFREIVYFFSRKITKIAQNYHCLRSYHMLNSI